MSSPRMAVGAAILLLVGLLAPLPSAAQAPPPGGAPAEAPAPAPAEPKASAQPGDPFGQEITLTERLTVYLKGSANWDSAFETLVDAFKSVQGYLDKEGIKAAGSAMVIYTQADDVGFEYAAAIPIGQEPKVRPQGDIAIGPSPSGKVLKFVHRGSYDNMDTTYEAITNYLDEKRLDIKDTFIEEYLTDPTKTPEDKLVINILVPTQ